MLIASLNKTFPSFKEKHLLETVCVKRCPCRNTNLVIQQFSVFSTHTHTVGINPVLFCVVLVLFSRCIVLHNIHSKRSRLLELKGTYFKIFSLLLEIITLEITSSFSYVQLSTNSDYTKPIATTSVTKGWFSKSASHKSLYMNVLIFLLFFSSLSRE